MSSSKTTSSTLAGRKTGRNPIQWLLDTIGTIRFGVVLLFLLFVYSGIGSAGLPLRLAFWEPGSWTAVRSWRGLEMTEYEWFNWWPFAVLIGLICTCLIITTLRRIPLKWVNLGVWMVHTGLIILAAGSVVYFATKIEGDVALARGRIVITVPGMSPDDAISMRTMPGASIESPDRAWRFRVIDTDPNWELLSGDDKGKTAYAVKVLVQTPQREFIRQLIAGFPNYTEDMVASGNPGQPWARAIKELGTPLADDALNMQLESDVQTKFYVMDSAALYLREVRANGDGSLTPLSDWIERPIDKLPRYHEYIEKWPDREPDVWLPTGSDELKTSTMALEIPPQHDQDPLATDAMFITSFLPYAILESRDVPGGTRLNPVLELDLTSSNGQTSRQRMFALDENPTSPDPALMRFVWADDDAALQRLTVRAGPRLRIEVPEAGVTTEVEITQLSEGNPDTPFTAVEGTDVSWRVRRFDDSIPIRGRLVDLARVELRNGNRTWLRWVFSRPELNGDFPLSGPTVAHVEGDREVDDSVLTTYLPAQGPPAPVTLIAGPQFDQLQLISTLLPGPPQVQAITVGAPVELGPDVTLTVTSYDARMGHRQQPRVIAHRARQPRAGGQRSMIKVRLPDAQRQAWLSFHNYPFADRQDALLRFPYQPTIITMPDGRMIEMLYSRRSAPLPSKVSLHGFDIRSHVGGFTGDVSSVLNWISNVHFVDEAGDMLSPVSVNNPQERQGYWYFQSQWDPPQTSSDGQIVSKGLNYTILGVGNRNGVWTMLFGGALSVLGMIWAFYIKPVIKRRAARAVFMSRSFEAYEELVHKEQKGLM